MNNSLLSEASSLSSLVSIGLVEKEVLRFSFTLWHRDYRVTLIFWLWTFALTHQSAKCDGHKSCGSRNVVSVNRKVGK